MVRRPEGRAPRGDARQLALLVDSVTDYAIFLLDPEGNVATWNPGAERIKGYRAEEIVGRHFSTFYTEADRVREHPQDELRIATREGRFEEEGWRLRKDGTRFWASVVITALFDEGRLVGFGKVTRDLTDRRAAAEALAATNRELERANEEMRLFSSAAAHDLREPLRTIGGFARLLGERHGGELSAQARELLELLDGGVDRMRELVDALLEFARTGARDVHLAPVALGGAADRVLAGLGAMVAEHRARVSVDLDAAAVVLADPVLLEVVLQNLLENAVKFGATAVSVRAERAGAAWRIEVADDGIGIAPADRERIFEPFRRLHGREAYGGSGLGLATCRRAVERQGGRIALESTPGRGATFRVELPAAP